LFSACLQTKLLRKALRTVHNAAQLIRSIVAAINQRACPARPKQTIKELEILLRDDVDDVKLGLYPLLHNIKSRLSNRHRGKPQSKVDISDYIGRCCTVNAQCTVKRGRCFDISRLSLGLLRSTKRALVKVSHHLY